MNYERVRFINNERHITAPEYYPKAGSVGTVLDIDEDDKNSLYVKWPEGSTSSDDCWWCGEEDVEPVNEWIPVSEQLPEAFTPVIVCRKSTQGKTTATVEQGMLTVNGWWKVYGTRTKAVTHWMPLPQPPEVKE